MLRLLHCYSRKNATLFLLTASYRRHKKWWCFLLKNCLKRSKCWSEKSRILWGLRRKWEREICAIYEAKVWVYKADRLVQVASVHSLTNSSLLHHFIPFPFNQKSHLKMKVVRTRNWKVPKFLLLIRTICSSSLCQSFLLQLVHLPSENMTPTRLLQSQSSSTTTNRTMTVHTITLSRPEMASALTNKDTWRTLESRTEKSKSNKDTSATPLPTVTQSQSNTLLMKMGSKPREIICQHPHHCQVSWTFSQIQSNFQYLFNQINFAEEIADVWAKINSQPQPQYYEQDNHQQQYYNKNY